MGKNKFAVLSGQAQINFYDLRNIMTKYTIHCVHNWTTVLIYKQLNKDIEDSKKLLKIFLR